MKYTDFPLIWRFESMIFKAKQFFRERSLHMTVHKLRRRTGTLGDASRKKYFNDFLFHFDQKMRLALRSMTFQTFCIFRTAQPCGACLFKLFVFSGKPNEIPIPQAPPMAIFTSNFGQCQDTIFQGIPVKRHLSNLALSSLALCKKALL